MVAPPFEIETADYEQERHIFEMWRWINAQFNAMEATPDFDSIYFNQSGRNVKKLIEEVIPVGYLGLRFVAPMQDVFIRCLTGGQPYDATLRVAGFRPLEIRVEVTTTETEETVFARQQLAENGTVHRPALSQTVGKKKMLRPLRMADMAEQYDGWIAVALERAERKVLSGRYDPLTAILVRVDTWSHLPRRWRSELINQTRARLDGQLASVYGVYYLHGCEIDAVRSKRD